MSCPPVSFLSESYLTRIKSSLVPNGVLIVNVAARSNDMYNSAIQSIQQVFKGGRLFISKASDDDANTVVFAINEDSPISLTTHPLMSASVKDWLLKMEGQETDPLGLFELAEEIKEIK